MSFVQIGFLGALAALTIPILIHLVFRQRPKRVDLGTLRFLRVVLEHNARRRRVMRWFLLALRMACLVLLAFMFSRPYLLAARQQGAKQTAVVLIDQSATMELKQDGVRTIDRAVTAAQDLLRQAPDNIRFEIAYFDHVVHPLRPRDSKTAVRPRELGRLELVEELRAPESCHGATDYGAAMEWARDVLAKAPAGPRQLHVFTDFQRSGLAWSEVDVLPEDIDTNLHDLGRAAVNNVAVTEARVDRSWLRPDEQTSLHVTVYNGSPFAANDLPVVLKLTSQNRKVELREQLKLEAGSFESLRFDLPALAEGLWQGAVTVEIEDDLPQDNVRPVALLASKPYQVLLVDGKEVTSPILASTYFLEAALRLAPPGELYSSSPFEPLRVGATEVPLSLAKFDVIVLSDVGKLDRRTCQHIVDRVNEGAGLLVFGGENVTAESTATLAAAGLAVGQISGVRRATDLPFRMRTWDNKHPIFAAFNDPQLGDLQRLSFSACTDIRTTGTATVLAAFGDGQPAVIERKAGKGTVVWFCSSCDRQWSDWTRSRLYLPFMYQLLGYQSGLAAGGKVRHQVLEGGMSESAATAPGIYPRDGFTLVVTESPRESETERCSLEEFVTRFGLKIKDQGVAATEAVPQQSGIGTELIDSEVWPWLAVMLLIAVLLEGLVANRTAA